MNLNFFRTIMGLFGGGGLITVIALLAKFAGCEIDDPATVANEVATCAASTVIPAKYTAYGTIFFMVIGGIAKLMKSGTVAQNLTAPSVPVVATKAEATVGVVTKAQVAEPGPAK